MVVLDRDLLIDLISENGYEAHFDDDVLVVSVKLEDGFNVLLEREITPYTRYSIPEFSIDLSKYQSFRGLAHIGPHGRICSFDPVTNSPNPTQPEKAVVEVLEHTIKILNDIRAGRCEDDYQDELSAYWDLECERDAYLFISDPNETSSLFGAKPKGQDDLICLAPSKQLASVYASRVGGRKVGIGDAFECLYLKLSNPLTYPFPKTIHEWSVEIEKSGDALFNRYCEAVSRCRKRAIVVMVSAPTNAGLIHLCFSQSTIQDDRGFRRGRRLFDFAVSYTDYGVEPVSRWRLNNASQKRLFKRGGDGMMMNGKQVIVGCGSLGSHLARTLIDAGARDLALVDKENLRIENVARHVCGFESIGKPKAHALKDYFEAGNPNVECIAYVEDANTLLGEKPSVFIRSSVVFITAADAPLEFHMSESMSRGTFRGPLVLMWLEPYVFAAHAIVLNKPQDVFHDLYDEQFRFLGSVLENADDLFMREPGCQSTYMPYSSLDAQAFIMDFVRDWQSEKAFDPEGNYHYIWIGRISDAGYVGARVNNQFANAQDYCHEIVRIG